MWQSCLPARETRGEGDHPKGGGGVTCRGLRQITPPPRYAGSPSPSSMGRQNYPTISSGLKKKSISIAAFSALSEPWTLFASIDSAKSLRIVPSSALAGVVAPKQSPVGGGAASASSNSTTTRPPAL